MGSVRYKGHTWFSFINLTHSWSIWWNRSHGSIIHQPTNGCFMYLSVNGESNNDDSNDAGLTLKIAIMVIFFLRWSSINCEAIGSLSIELLNSNTKSFILKAVSVEISNKWRVFQMEVQDSKTCEFCLKNILTTDNETNKTFLLGGDFNINLLHFSHNKKAQDFVNLLFWFSIVSTTNKPTRVNIDFITAIGHIITNSILDCDFKIGKSGKWTDLAHSIKICKMSKKILYFYHEKEILAHFIKNSNFFIFSQKRNSCPLYEKI